MKNNKNIKINFCIGSSSTIVRLLDEYGKMIGLFALDSAIKIARKKKLDLVEVSSNSNPKVCKIVNSGKYKYFVKKKKISFKKKNKSSDLKEIRLRPNIAISDLKIKLSNVKKFISQGNKVKITLIFKGREIVHEEIGFLILKKFKTLCLGFSDIEFDIKREGKKMFILIIPKKNIINNL